MDQLLEIWLPVVGYEGLYEDSNLGRVKSLNYRHTGIERILKPKKDKDGYLQIGLCKDGKAKMHLVHRLVATSFLPNPHNLPEINHINEQKDDNRVENLQWCDRQYNIEYSQAKPVLQLTLDGQLVREWSSAAEAERLGGYTHAHISKCCLGKLKKHSGFIWRFKD